jgi:hypothetical protein
MFVSEIGADVTAVELGRFWKRMLTALPYRFYFKAIGLASFRVPTGKPDSQSDGHFIRSFPGTCSLTPRMSANFASS